VRREIDWLAGAGLSIDTLGLGEHPDERVAEHFAIGGLPRWAKTRWGQLVLHVFVPVSLRFRALTLSRLPKGVKEQLRARAYDTIIFNEYEFVPWVTDRRLFDPKRTHIHLDLHEYHEPKLQARTRWARLTGGYYRWMRKHIGSPQFSSRSTVASGIADLYEREFGFDKMSLVRNAPPYVEQAPSPVDPDRIRLLFHGMASWARGFTQIIDALDGLDERYSMTFMLTQPQHNIDRLRALIDERGLTERARIVPPSPMREISRRINEYDLEIVFYPSTTTNVRLALPNKIFEAIQGRLGLVIGHSPMLEEIVVLHGNGVVVDGWTGADLRDALNALTPEKVAHLKEASARAAQHLNAENEGATFLAALGITPGPPEIAG
jgi:hypothetical protein